MYEMIKHSFVFPFLILYCFLGNAQSDLVEVRRDFSRNPNYATNQNYIRLAENEKNKNAENIYFAFKDWAKAEVYVKETDPISIDSANYHVVDDQMFFIKNGKLSFIYPDAIEKIKIGNRLYKPFIADGAKMVYYEVLANGKLLLLKKLEIRKERVLTNPLGISDGSQQYKETRKEKLFYYSTKKALIKEVPKKKKNLIKIFPKHKYKVTQFVKENGLLSKSETDLIKIFDYYNQLESD